MNGELQIPDAQPSDQAAVEKESANAAGDSARRQNLNVVVAVMQPVFKIEQRQRQDCGKRKTLAADINGKPDQRTVADGSFQRAMEIMSFTASLLRENNTGDKDTASESQDPGDSYDELKKPDRWFGPHQYAEQTENHTGQNVVAEPHESEEITTLGRFQYCTEDRIPCRIGERTRYAEDETAKQNEIRRGGFSGKRGRRHQQIGAAGNPAGKGDHPLGTETVHDSGGRDQKEHRDDPDQAG